MCLFQLALEKYEEMFPAFTDSRECKLLKVSEASIKITHSHLAMQTALCFVLFRLATGLAFFSKRLKGHQTHSVLASDQAGGSSSSKMMIVVNLNKSGFVFVVGGCWWVAKVPPHRGTRSIV